jgi:ketosteroid isomerase-like protein
MSQSSTAEVERLVRDLNAAWLEGRIEDLDLFFHEQVAMAPPGGASRVVGREKMVDSFREFLAVAKVHEFETLDLQVNLFGPTAIAGLRFRIRYEMQGQVYDEKGTDVLVLNRDDEAWRVVWRTQIPVPPPLTL